MRRLPGLLAISTLACVRPPSGAIEPGPTRMAILDPAYGAHPDHPHALMLDQRVEALALPLADGGEFVLDDARRAGPVVLAWIGGAEHESLTAWVRQLDAGLRELDARAATLVFVRPLAVEPSLRWAEELGLRAAVAADPVGAFAVQLDLVGPDRPPPTIDFAVLIVDGDGEVAYRKLGGRRPEIDELLAVLDGEADNLRCCPGACVGAACVGG